MLRRLEANLAAASVCRDASALDESGLSTARLILSRLTEAGSGGGEERRAEGRCGSASAVASPASLEWPAVAAGAAEACAWLQPVSRARWSAVSGIAAQLSSVLASQGIAHQLQYASFEGLTVDVALLQHVPDAQLEPLGGGGGSEATLQSQRVRVAVMICAACDVSPQAAPRGTDAPMSAEGAVLRPKELSGRMQQHVGLLRRRCGVPVVCLSAEHLAAVLSRRGTAEVSMQWLESL